jgi:hypothetical protein
VRPVRAGLFCASLFLLNVAACDDAFGPRQRPTGIRPDSNSARASLSWYELQPRVITIGQTDSVRVTVGVDGIAQTVQLQTLSGLVPLLRQSNGTYTGRFVVSDLLFGYRTGDLHNAGVRIDVTAAPPSAEQTVMIINVKDGTVSTVNTQTLLSGLMQASSHVVNIRSDSLFSGPQVPGQILRTFYQAFGDDYDFINVIEQVQRPAPYSYFAVRNSIVGLGLTEFERADAYGNPRQLQGFLLFPNEGFFDLAETGVLHELAHRWMNFGNLPTVRVARPHWPISTLAFGVTGAANPTTGEPLPFRYELTRQPNATYTVRVVADRRRLFNDFELYLMGLLPPDSVSPHIVFSNQQQYDQLRPGGLLAGATDTLTVDEWISRDGVRNPNSEGSQRLFRMATIVLSRGRLLTREEMSFFNHMAGRGESLLEVQALLNNTRGPTLPFTPATGGRAQLITRLN